MVSKQGADGNPGTEAQAFLQGLKHSRKAAWKRCGKSFCPHTPG
jgi:hypothetical protein